MSEQEMQFADPEWTPSTKLEDAAAALPRPINRTAGEEPESIIPPYEQDKLPGGQEYPLAKRPGRRIGRRTFTVGLLIAGIGTSGGLLWLFNRHSVPAVHNSQSPAQLSQPTQPAQPAQGYPPQETDSGPERTVKLLSNPPTVIVKCNGDVTITGSLPMEVDAHAIYRRPYTGNSIASDAIHFSLNKQGNVELLLSDGTAFQLHAKTGGTITNDFPPATPTPFLQAQLFITADHGDIVIKKSF